MSLPFKSLLSKVAVIPVSAMGLYGHATDNDARPGSVLVDLDGLRLAGRKIDTSPIDLQRRLKAGNTYIRRSRKNLRTIPGFVSLGTLTSPNGVCRALSLL